MMPTVYQIEFHIGEWSTGIFVKEVFNEKTIQESYEGTSKHFKIGVLIALRSSRRFARSYLIVLCKYFLFLSEIMILIT